MGLPALHLEYKIEEEDLSENRHNSGYKKHPVSYQRQIHPPYLTVTSESKLEKWL